MRSEVSGPSRGAEIGAALVRALVAGGAVVVIADTDEAGAKAVADQLNAPAAGGTRHAVVGLSLALRAEAAGRGVRVSVVCPGFVDTPLLSHVNPDLPQTETGSTAVALPRLTGRLYDAESLAGDVLRGVARNQAVIVAPARARLAWRMTRYAPRLSMRMLTAAIRRA